MTPDRVIDVLLAGWSSAGQERIVQAAADGRWEDARAVGMPADEGEVRALVGGTGEAGADVAVELEWLGRPLVFVGARRRAGDDPAAFAERVVRAAALEPPEPSGLLAALAGGVPAEPAEIELGAANAWRSVGPLRLWTRGEEPRVGDLDARLRGHPALARCVAPVALEIAFARPCECWIGVEVSRPDAGEHVVDVASLDTLLARLFAALAP